MGLKKVFRSLVKKYLIRKLPSLKKLHDTILADNQLVIVDVGAAGGLQRHWAKLVDTAEAYLFEPGEEEFQKLVASCYSKKQNIHLLSDALSGSGGERILYVTNVPTGSSLLKPNQEVIEATGAHDYFYPMKEVPILTKRLDAVLHGNGVTHVDMIKLDVQGTEYEILSSLPSALMSQFVAVEMELGLHGSYEGMPSFMDVDALMKEQHLELYDMRTNRRYCRVGNSITAYQTELLRSYANPPCVAARLVEFDLIYFKSTDFLIKNKDEAGLRRVVVAMCTYNFFSEAYRVIEQAAASGIFSEQASIQLKKAILLLNQHEMRPYYRRGLFWALVRKLFKLTPDAQWAQYMQVQYPNF